MRYFLIVIVFITGCKLENRKVTPVTFYYDNEKAKVKAKGYFENERETSKWSFLSEEGVVLREGKYETGLLTGNWSYNYPYFNSEINWKIHSDKSGKLSLSLPSTFRLDKADDHTILMAYDTIKGDGFGISVNNYKNIPDILKHTKEDIERSFVINSNQYIEVSTTDGLYYYGWFKVLDTTKSKAFIIQSYVGEVEGDFFDIAYRSSNEDSISSRLLFSEIFEHAYFKGRRINNPIAEILKVTPSLQ